MALTEAPVPSKQPPLTQVATFARDVVGPLVECPELALLAGELDGVVAKAGDAGLLPGLLDESATGAFAAEALRLLAQVNGGIAFAVHRLALADRLRARLGLAGASPACVSLYGHYAFGRSALPRLLAGRELDAEHVALLSDWLDGATHQRVVIGVPWRSLITAGFDGRQIVWRQVSRTDCEVQVQPNSHGFDELETATVRYPDTAADGVADTAAFTEALYLDGLGMIAINTGLVDHALQIARSWASQRVQGGNAIDSYPAVQQMLAQISMTARNGTLHLASLAGREPTAEALVDLFAVRSTFDRECCVAANNAIQVLGGRGCMQDFGPEKLVRDANTLRILGGTPTELRLFVAEWERAR
jgi:acyl-CoA dehydrogenase-like protein